MSTIGRPRTCECGSCRRCEDRERQRVRYQAKTLPERRALVARRSRVAVREADTRRYANRTPERQAALRASVAVRNAVRDGRLTRLPCEVCGDPRTHGHHYLGYAPEHRFDVRWLCKAHHDEAHGIVRPGVS